MAIKIAVIIPAAGLGKRFACDVDRTSEGGGAGGSAVNKIECELAGRPVFLRSVELFAGRADVSRVVLAVNPDAVDAFKFKYEDRLALYDVNIVAGGRVERWETVQQALDALDAIDPTCTHVAVHDAARPLTSSDVIDRVFDAATQFDAVIPAMPVSGTLKRVADDVSGHLSVRGHAAGIPVGPITPPITPLVNPPVTPVDPITAILGGLGDDDATVPTRIVQKTIDRTNVVEVQTPQVFEKTLLKRAYARIADGQVDPTLITDDAGLVEAMGQCVYVVDGDAMNFKITRSSDLDLAQAIVQAYHRNSEIDSVAKRLFASVDDDE